MGLERFQPHERPHLAGLERFQPPREAKYCRLTGARALMYDTVIEWLAPGPECMIPWSIDWPQGPTVRHVCRLTGSRARMCDTLVD